MCWLMMYLEEKELIIAKFFVGSNTGARQQLTSATRGGDLRPVHAIDPHIVLLVLRRSTRRTRSPLQYGDSIYVPDETGLL